MDTTIDNPTAVEEKAVIDTAATTEIAVIVERTIRDKIYEVRGVKVMLDFELAEIYGYSTSAFNQQVRRNANRFPDDFRFQLTQNDLDELSRSQIVILNRGEGRGSNLKYLPWAFTESGIYMLMSVLKGELAVTQSIALIRTFRAMKDYIVENQSLVGQRDLLRISIQTAENTEAIRQVQVMMREHDDKLADVLEQLGDTVKSSEISPFLLDFSKPEDQREYLLMNGQPAKADETYINIYSTVIAA